MQQKDDINKLIEDCLAFGDLLLIANKGIGKTNALMVLAEYLRNLDEKTRVIIFEDFPKFALEFSQIPYFVIKDSDVLESSHVIDAEDYFLRHERDYTINRGSQIEEFLENKDCCFVMEIADIERSAFFVYAIVNHFYRKAYLRKFKGYQATERIIFVIEESQNVFDSSTISKKIFNRLRKIFSVARNLDLHFVLASQRLQDLNTKIRGRTRLLIGQPSIDDYQLKIERLLKHSQHRKTILTLERGKFLYCSSDEIINFPKFFATGKPYEYKALDTETEKKEALPIGAKVLKAFVGAQEAKEKYGID